MASVSKYKNSVLPMTGLALSNSTIQVEWSTPSTYPEKTVTLTSASGSATTITVSSTTDLLVNQRVEVTSGTGTFVFGTIVTSITSSTTFTVSQPPSVSLSGATIYAYTEPYKVLRLVRNQYAYSETQEDGQILYEFNNSANTGLEPIEGFTDGVTSSLSSISLVSGQYAYYSVWLLVTNTWVLAGTCTVLLPKDHGSYNTDGDLLKSNHTKIMESLPRFLTSTSNTAFDEIDASSDIYKFFKGISLTYDEILTYADLTIRSLPGKYMSNNMVLNAFNDLGIRVTSTSPTFYKKALIGKIESLKLTKGTASTLANFVETFTGYNTSVSDSTQPSNPIGLTNLLLTAQDSSFHKGGIGNWKNVSYSTLAVEGGNVTLTGVYGSGTTLRADSTTGLVAGQTLFIASGTGAFSSTTATTISSITDTNQFVVSLAPTTTLVNATVRALFLDIPTAEDYSIKSPYRLKVTTNATSGINYRLGPTAQTTSVYDFPKYGISISPGTQYTFSFYCKGGSYNPSLQPYIVWGDKYGNQTGTDTATAISTSSSWAKYSYSVTSSGYYVTATDYTLGSSSTVITLPVGHGFNTTAGTNKIWLESFALPFVGGYTISAFTSTSITIPFGIAPVTLSTVSSSGNIFTITSGTLNGVTIGQTIAISSGTGTLNGTTTVTGITGASTFTVSAIPTVALSGATITFSYDKKITDFTVFKATTGGVKEGVAQYALLGFKQTSATNGGTYYLDSIQFNAGAVSNFIEARSVDIYVNPNKYNYLIDPTFNASSSGWSAPGNPGGWTQAEYTTLTGIPYTSTSKMGKVITSASTTDSSNPDLKTAVPTPITINNTYYTFSIYIKGDAEYTLNLALTDGVNTSTPTVMAVTTDWKRFSTTLYVTSTATGLTPYIYGTRTSAAATFRVDDAQLEEGQSPSDYFDGGFYTQGARWTGAADASSSYLYINKEQKLSELSVHLDDWIPINTVWMLRSLTGIEAIGVPSATSTDSTAPYTSSGGGGGSRNTTVFA